jgi:NADPH:quinone reductase-like Zn-dependent oxidoreductase
VVSVRAVALGPWDLSAADGYFRQLGGSTSFPQVQGWDFAGQTADGRRVLGFTAQPWMGVGALAEQIAMPAALLAPLPDGLDWAQGAALPVSALTARLLNEAAKVSRGDLGPWPGWGTRTWSRRSTGPSRPARTAGRCTAAGRSRSAPW